MNDHQRGGPSGAAGEIQVLDHPTEPLPTPMGRSTRSHLRFIVRRLLLAPVILLGVALAVFVVIDFSPNDPARAALGFFADDDARARFAAEHGLDDPLPVRFVRFLGDLVHFDLGPSAVRPESVGELIALALPMTLQLLAISAVLAVIISLFLGTLAARAEGRWPDRIISFFAAIFQSSPQFWVGLLFIQLFAVGLGVLPSGGYQPLSAGFIYWFSSMVGPAVVLALPFSAQMTRIVRASMADELAKDYVRTAIGAGVPLRTVLWRNVLRNALITPITVLGVHLGAAISSAILVETVFNLPGMGSLLVSGVSQGDLGIVRGVAIVGAAAFVVINLLVDFSYLILNPRSAEASSR
ncbi:ABC transporter permease [Amycolatopsis thermoflava]|uniref:ABC transporter permease n=1 Tax=Amycolatopsis thermoflava TaxID=84480 RepID=UPI003F49DB5A